MLVPWEGLLEILSSQAWNSRERGESLSLGKMKVAKDCKPRQEIMKGIKGMNARGDPTLRIQSKGS